MARKLEAAEARDTAYGEQNILFAHQPMDRPGYSARYPNLQKTDDPPPTPPTVEGENRDILGSTLSNYAQTSEWYLSEQIPKPPLTAPPAKSDSVCDESATNMFLLVNNSHQLENARYVYDETQLAVQHRYRRPSSCGQVQRKPQEL
ncbi:hypothetical protein RAB80_014057 [Fusarium oxysporum f. sp. vasinfectum]|nr:hypothetical protein RAB80_014057 [Fusarium oxysporum f. sp. vasinfectum]